MRKAFAFLLLVFPTTFFAQNATIILHIGRSIAEIDPRIYRVFMEPIPNGKRSGPPGSVEFNALYGSLCGPSSPLADENCVRQPRLENDLH